MKPLIATSIFCAGICSVAFAGEPSGGDAMEALRTEHYGYWYTAHVHVLYYDLLIAGIHAGIAMSRWITATLLVCNITCKFVLLSFGNLKSRLPTIPILGTSYKAAASNLSTGLLLVGIFSALTSLPYLETALSYKDCRDLWAQVIQLCDKTRTFQVEIDVRRNLEVIKTAVARVDSRESAMPHTWHEKAVLKSAQLQMTDRVTRMGQY